MQTTLPTAQIRSMVVALMWRIIQLPRNLPTMKNARARVRHERGRAVVHPMHAGDEIDEVGIDGNLCHLIAQQGQEAEHKHLVIGKELADIATLCLIFSVSASC